MENGKYNPTEVEIAMLAAYIDGEGCILIREKKESSPAKLYTYAAILVTNTDVRLPVWIKARFGGSVNSLDYQNMDKSRRRKFDWRVERSRAVEILKMCMPYFVIKAEQAKIAIAHDEFVKAIRTGSLKESRAAYHASREVRLKMKFDLSKLKRSSRDIQPSELKG